jgi:hypothetical protein
VIFKDTAAMVSYWSVSDTRLHLYDGQSRWTIDFAEPVRDVISDGEIPFVLSGISPGEGSIFEATDLKCRCPADFTRIVKFFLWR